MKSWQCPESRGEKEVRNTEMVMGELCGDLERKGEDRRTIATYRANCR